jgi:hypothetical protein
MVTATLPGQVLYEGLSTKSCGSMGGVVGELTVPGGTGTSSVEKALAKLDVFLGQVHHRSFFPRVLSSHPVLPSEPRLFPVLNHTWLAGRAIRTIGPRLFFLFTARPFLRTGAAVPTAYSNDSPFFKKCY